MNIVIITAINKNELANNLNFTLAFVDNIPIIGKVSGFAQNMVSLLQTYVQWASLNYFYWSGPINLTLLFNVLLK